MNNLRFNIFNQVHKALRAMLYDTAIAIQRTDFSREEQARKVFKKIETVLWLFDGHAETEDTMIFPLLKAIAPDVVDDFEQQHDADHALSHDLYNIIAAYNFARTETDMLHAGIKLLQAFNEFTAFNLQHMNKEETIINSLLWQHFTDIQLLELQKEIVSKVPPDKNEIVGRWMIKGISDMEMIVWLSKLKQTIPAAAFNCLYSFAAQELPEERWAHISRCLEERTTAA